jgi:hypothetical protein
MTARGRSEERPGTDAGQFGTGEEGHKANEGRRS